MRDPSLQPFVALARAACGTAFALALASACGGQSFKGSGGEAGDAGSGGSSSRAGSGNSSGSGGKAHAGSGSGGSGVTAGTGSSSGGSGVTAGTGSGGAPVMSACAGPSESSASDGSSCNGYLLRWTHDIATGLCTPVAYSGCGATKNNYETLEACQKACPGGSPNYDACKAPTDCVLAASGCCGVCDGPSVTKHDFLAYNGANAAKVTPCAGDVACGACPAPLPNQGTIKYFVPNCVAGECVVEDIRESDVTACTSAQDCRLRAGTGCCESCGASDVVSVRNDGSLEKLVCGDVIPPCLACEPAVPSGAVANCAADGHCEIVYQLK